MSLFTFCVVTLNLQQVVIKASGTKVKCNLALVPSPEQDWTGFGFFWLRCDTWSGFVVFKDSGLDSQVWIYLFLHLKHSLDPETRCVFIKLCQTWTGPDPLEFVRDTVRDQ